MTVRLRTVSGPASAEIVVERSRFLARVERVDDEAAARAVLEEERREHWSARHHCLALAIAPDADSPAGSRVERSNDDGEPAGTAGAPMLEAIRGRDLSDVVVVVTRWFGGVLLGTGGLARAYGRAAATALDEAGVVQREVRRLGEVAIGHDRAGRLENELRARGIAILDRAYDDRARLRVVVPEGAGVEALLAEISGGDAELTWRGRQWVDC